MNNVFIQNRQRVKHPNRTFVKHLSVGLELCRKYKRIMIAFVNMKENRITIASLLNCVFYTYTMGTPFSNKKRETFL